jgi:hypothetical protein
VNGAQEVAAVPASIPSAARVMPRSWFSAQAVATTMAALMHPLDRDMPLQPGERILGRFVLPPFQRPPVWTRAQQVRFLESVWMGLPIGAIVFNQVGALNSPFDQWLLDGQQRVTSVYAYMADEFPVFGHHFSEIGVIDRRRWGMSISFPAMMTQIEDEAELRDIYDRLAYGGTPHAQAIEARSDETEGLGPKGESAVGETDAPAPQPEGNHP